MLRYVLDERRWLRLLEESDAEELYAVIEANREARRTSIGYWIAESAQGRGVATRTAGAPVDHAFTA
jgi:RimJ/RimL family protein N-acetyltransferase